MSATFRFSSFVFNFAISVTSLRSFSAKTNDGTVGIKGQWTERQRLANSEWQVANNEWRMMSFLEGSAPALPKIRRIRRCALQKFSPNKFGAQESSSSTTG
jgi:hypothetical protein